MTRLLVVPVAASLFVLSVASTLLTIGARSPYTHDNLQPQYVPGFARTEQIFLGPTDRHDERSQHAPIVDVAGEPVDAGRHLFVAQGCAGCHGLTGEGGVVGPPNARVNLATLRQNVRLGPGGMPAYGPGQLTDDEVVAIQTYLNVAPPR
jgi:mono/diheme cytochrome c family protein